MKAIKYIIIIFVLLFCTGITSEVYQNYLYVLNDEFYSTTFYLQRDTLAKNMLNDIQQCADENNLYVFMIDKKSLSSHKTIIDIYANEQTTEVLAKEYMIRAGSFQSFFGGTTLVNISNFDLIEQSLLEINNTFYLIGNKKDMDSFKVDLVVKYAGAFPQEGGMHNRQYMKQMISVVWLVALFLIIFMTFYEISCQERENILRITLGESIWKIVFQNFFMDTIFIGVSYLILKKGFEYISNVTLFTKENNIAVSVIILINALLYFKLFRMDLKKAFSHAKLSNRVILFNYLIKMIITICVTLILATNFAVIYEATLYYKQKNFYQMYSDYNYIQFGTAKDIDVSGEVIDNAAALFYQSYFRKADIVGLTQDVVLEQKETAVANDNAWRYLVSKIPELSKVEHENRNLLIVPEAYELSKENELFLSGFFEDYDNYEIIRYDTNASLVVQDSVSLQKSKLCKSPVIVFEGKNDFSDIEENENPYELLFSFNQLLINVSEIEVKQFLSDNKINIDFVMTNAMENFQYHWLILKRAMVLNIILSAIFLMLELLIDITLVKLEYQNYAIELSLKKLFGYSFMERNKNMLMMTIVGNVISLLAVLIVCMVNHLGNTILIISGDLLLLFLQVVVILYYAQKQELANANKLLKGGIL